MKVHTLNILEKSPACGLVASATVIKPQVIKGTLYTGMLAGVSCAGSEIPLVVETLRPLPDDSTYKEQTIAQGQAKTIVLEAARTVLAQQCETCVFNRGM